MHIWEGDITIHCLGTYKNQFLFHKYEICASYAEETLNNILKVIPGYLAPILKKSTKEYNLYFDSIGYLIQKFCKYEICIAFERIYKTYVEFRRAIPFCDFGLFVILSAFKSSSPNAGRLVSACIGRTTLEKRGENK